VGAYPLSARFAKIDFCAFRQQDKQMLPLNQVSETIDILGRSGLSFIPEKGVNLMQAYCMKCRSKREMKDAKAITMKNGKPATQGVCPVCGTKMFRIGKS